tara:strand:+ start:192 stop:1136 length:945 start_codon:yes stop_codon:yes gene_type:complete
MQEANSNKHFMESDNSIDLQELFNVILNGKWIIASVTALFSIIGVIFSLYLPNIYQSKALLAPVQASSGISGALQNYSGIAGLAGISLPKESDEGNSAKAIHKISSLSFFENNILPNIFLPNLMAFKSWDSKKNILNYNTTIYDIKSNTWIRDYSYPQKQTPSSQESFDKFITEHLSVIENKKSGFVTLSIKHQSPLIAKKWAELVVDKVNSFYRQKDKAASERSVSYLDKQISISNLSEINRVLAELLQDETKKLALIEANQDYVFEYIDPPALMEKKSEPRRAFICILSFILGGMLSILSVLIKHYVFKEKT